MSKVEKEEAVVILEKKKKVVINLHREFDKARETL